MTYEGHVAILPEYWGRSEEIGPAAMRWMFKHSPARRMIAKIPASNRLAIRFAKTCGLVQFGIDEKSYLKNGILRDRVCLGLSKEELIQCPVS